MFQALGNIRIRPHQNSQYHKDYMCLHPVPLRRQYFCPILYSSTTSVAGGRPCFQMAKALGWHSGHRDSVAPLVPAPISDLKKKPGKPKSDVRLRIRILSNISRIFVPLKNSIRVRIRRMRIQDQGLNSNSANNMPIPEILIRRISANANSNANFVNIRTLLPTS
jgi:hypothetical protein